MAINATNYNQKKHRYNEGMSINIDGIHYTSISEASNRTGISQYKLKQIYTKAKKSSFSKIEEDVLVKKTLVVSVPKETK